MSSIRKLNQQKTCKRRKFSTNARQLSNCTMDILTPEAVNLIANYREGMEGKNSPVRIHSNAIAA